MYRGCSWVTFLTFNFPYINVCPLWFPRVTVILSPNLIEQSSKFPQTEKDVSKGPPPLPLSCFSRNVCNVFEEIGSGHRIYLLTHSIFVILEFFRSLPHYSRLVLIYPPISAPWWRLERIPLQDHFYSLQSKIYQKKTGKNSITYPRMDRSRNDVI